MSLEETLRAIVREELKSVLRTDLLPRLAEDRCAKQEEDGYFSVQKAADFADVHPDTIRSWVKSGRLREHRAGRELRILRSDLHRFLAGVSANGHRATEEEEAATILAQGRSG